MASFVSTQTCRKLKRKSFIYFFTPVAMYTLIYTLFQLGLAGTYDVRKAFSVFFFYSSGDVYA